MSNVSGCEMMNCEFYKFSKERGRKVCTDPCPLYDRVCRHNDYWQTPEGIEEADAYFAKVEAADNGEAPNAENGDTVRGVADILTELRDYDMSDGQQALCDELEKAINRIRNARDRRCRELADREKDIECLKELMFKEVNKRCAKCQVKVRVVDEKTGRVLHCEGAMDDDITGGCDIRAWRFALGMDGEDGNKSPVESQYKAQLRDACHMLCFRCGQNDSAQGENAVFKCKLPNGECNVHEWRKSVGMDGEGAAK